VRQRRASFPRPAMDGDFQCKGERAWGAGAEATQGLVRAPSSLISNEEHQARECARVRYRHLLRRLLPPAPQTSPVIGPQCGGGTCTFWKGVMACGASRVSVGEEGRQCA
jgi:hypothetical protein